jgi:thiol-disulfide isomerase/thioredoxin
MSKQIDASIPILKKEDMNLDTSLNKYNNGITLILFHMEGCPHCVHFIPEFIKASKEYSGDNNVTFVTTDIVDYDGPYIQQKINSIGSYELINKQKNNITLKNKQSGETNVYKLNSDGSFEDENGTILSRLAYIGKPRYYVRGFPKLVGYKNGKFYAVYSKGNNNFRKAKDVVAFVEGIRRGVPVEIDPQAAS